MTPDVNTELESDLSSASNFCVSGNIGFYLSKSTSTFTLIIIIFS